jgi:hypothetical protein
MWLGSQEWIGTTTYFVIEENASGSKTPIGLFLEKFLSAAI